MTVFDKASKAAIMKMIVEKCLRAKEDNNNRMPWGFASSLVAEYGDTFTFLSATYIRVAVHRAEKLKKEKLKTISSPSLLVPPMNSNSDHVPESVDTGYNAEISSIGTSIFSDSVGFSTSNESESEKSICSKMEMEKRGPTSTTLANVRKKRHT